MADLCHAKKDLSELVQSGLLTEIKLNKQKSGYIKGPDFDSTIYNVIKNDKSLSNIFIV